VQAGRLLHGRRRRPLPLPCRHLWRCRARNRRLGLHRMQERHVVPRRIYRGDALQVRYPNEPRTLTSLTLTLALTLTLTLTLTQCGLFYERERADPRRASPLHQVRCGLVPERAAGDSLRGLREGRLLHSGCRHGAAYPDPKPKPKPKPEPNPNPDPNPDQVSPCEAGSYNDRVGQTNRRSGCKPTQPGWLWL